MLPAPPGPPSRLVSSAWKYFPLALDLLSKGATHAPSPVSALPLHGPSYLQESRGVEGLFPPLEKQAMRVKVSSLCLE